MKKSHFATLILGVIGVLFLGLGMCMCLLPEWGLFQQGIFTGCVGLAFLLIMIVVYRQMEHKPTIRFSLKSCFTVFIGIIGALGLGIGMCLTMVFDSLLLGIMVGIVGIILLLALIPLCKGIRD